MNHGTPQRPRAMGPEFLAVWEPFHDYWRLQVLDRGGQPEDSVWTRVPASRPRPGNEFLAGLGFVALADEDWQRDGEGWQRGVARSIPSGNRNVAARLVDSCGSWAVRRR